jgi:hypothetical protein
MGLRKHNLGYQPPPIVGDLVFHLLYGKEWAALLLKVEKHASETREYALLHMVPGTEYEFWFKKQLKKYRINDRKGYVSYHWLRNL